MPRRADYTGKQDEVFAAWKAKITELATCPLYRWGLLRLIAALTQESFLTRILRHGTLASVPPPLAPTRARQATFAWAASAHAGARGLGGDVRAAEGCLTPRRVGTPVYLSPPVALPEAGAPGHSGGPTLPHPAAPVQAVMGLAAGCSRGRPRHAGEAGKCSGGGR